MVPVRLGPLLPSIRYQTNQRGNEADRNSRLIFLKAHPDPSDFTIMTAMRTVKIVCVLPPKRRYRLRSAVSSAATAPKELCVPVATARRLPRMKKSGRPHQPLAKNSSESESLIRIAPAQPTIHELLRQFVRAWLHPVRSYFFSHP